MTPRQPTKKTVNSVGIRFKKDIPVRPSNRLLLLVLALLVQLVSSTQAQNAVPQLNQPLVPQNGPPKTGFTLTVNGTGFVSGSIVKWNGSPKTTTFINGQQLSAAISSQDDAVDGTATVTVQNPSGTTSNVGYFSITRQISSRKIGMVSTKLNE